MANKNYRVYSRSPALQLTRGLQIGSKNKKGKHEVYVCKLNGVKLMYQEFNLTSTVETVNYGKYYIFLIDQHWNESVTIGISISHL